MFYATVTALVCTGQGLVKEIGRGKTRMNADKSGSNPRSSALICVLYNSKQCLTITVTALVFVNQADWARFWSKPLNKVFT